MSDLEFKAPWGRVLRVTSISFTLLMLGVSLFLIVQAEPHFPARKLAFACLPTLILVSTVPFIIRRYRLRNETLLIDRLFWATEIPLTGLSSVEVTENAMKGSLRLCGNGGLYSFSGWWWSKRLGRYHPYVTDLDRTVVLRFGPRTIVLSPEIPTEFARDVSRFVTNPEPSGPAVGS